MSISQVIKVILVVLFFSSAKAQEIQALVLEDSTQVAEKEQLKINYKQLIIPTVLIGYGIIGLESHQLLSFNTEIRTELKEHIDDKFTIDDFSQYTPIASIYALDALGIKGKNNFKDKAIISATAYLIMGLTVNSLKKVSVVARPDGTSFNSFPSGHTATAFMGAELLHQEYKDVSIWYSVSGYAIATGTGLFRMYNNRHWLSDVVTGAGIGIISAKMAYWVYPTVNKLFKKNNNKSNNSKISFSPFYNGKTTGFCLVSTF